MRKSDWMTKRFTALFAPLFAISAGLLLSAAAPADDPSAPFRAMLADAPLAPKVAPKGYDVTIVLFSDYQCPYCKKQHFALLDLLAKDPKVRLIYRDWPVFGPVSKRAARLAIASQYQGRHAAFHDALMRAKGKLDENAMKAAARTAKVDWARLEADATSHRAEIDALLRQTDRQAEALELEGTPGLVIGRYVLTGALNPDGLAEVVKLARAD